VGLVDWLYAYTAAAEYLSGVPLLATPRPAPVYGAVKEGARWTILLASLDRLNSFAGALQQWLR